MARGPPGTLILEASRLEDGFVELVAEVMARQGLDTVEHRLGRDYLLRLGDDHWYGARLTCRHRPRI